MALFYSSVSVSHDSETVRQQHREPETEAAKWNSAIIDLIIYMRFS